jgi:hypothetical protein
MHSTNPNPDSSVQRHRHNQPSKPSATQPAAVNIDTFGPASSAWMWLLLGGYGAALIFTVWTLATTLQHRWWLAATLTLTLLARLVPDALEITDWACRGAPTWQPPIDPCPRPVTALAALATGLAAVTTRWPAYPEFAQWVIRLQPWALWLDARLPPRTARSRRATVIAALVLAALIAGWAALQAPSP